MHASQCAWSKAYDVRVLTYFEMPIAPSTAWTPTAWPRGPSVAADAVFRAVGLVRSRAAVRGRGRDTSGAAHLGGQGTV